MSKLNLSSPMFVCAGFGVFEAAHNFVFAGGGDATLFVALCCGALRVSARIGKL